MSFLIEIKPIKRRMLKITRVGFMIISLCITCSVWACPADLDDTCRFADQLRAEMAKALPMQMSETMALRQVSQFQNHLNLYIWLGYNRDYLMEIYKPQGLSLNDAKIALRKFAKNYGCSAPAWTFWIERGLVLNFYYQFIDGDLLTSFAIDSCKS